MNREGPNLWNASSTTFTALLPMIVCPVSFLQNMWVSCGTGTWKKPCRVRKLFTKVHALTARVTIDFRGFPQVKSWIQRAVSPSPENNAGMAYAVSWTAIISRIWSKTAKVANTCSGVGVKNLWFVRAQQCKQLLQNHACMLAVDHDMTWSNRLCMLRCMMLHGCDTMFMLWFHVISCCGLCCGIVNFASQALSCGCTNSSLRLLLSALSLVVSVPDWNSLTLASGHGWKTSFKWRGTQIKSC